MVTDPLPPGLPVSEEVFRSFPAEVQAAILSRVEQVRILTARVNDLESRLNRNSSNASKPPSSDPARAGLVREKKKPTGRRQGG